MMNETGKNRTDRWLPVVATVVLFRALMIPTEAITSTLCVAFGRISYEFIQHVRCTLPILAPVIAVALAVLVARAVEVRLLTFGHTGKRVFLIVLVVLALLPWQLQVKTTARPVTWAEVPEDMKKEMGLLSAGCTPYGPPLQGHVFSGAYQGVGLYVDNLDMTVTNETDTLAVHIPVFNGYHKPVFLNVDQNVMFGNPTAPDVECYDGQDQLILSGSLGKKISYGVDGHAQKYIRIPAGHTRNGALVRMCTNFTSVPYNIGLSKVVPTPEWLTPTETETNKSGNVVSETYDMTPVPPPPLTQKMVLKVPVRFRYILEDETREHSCDIDIRITVVRKVNNGQQSVAPLPRVPQTGHSGGKR